MLFGLFLYILVYIYIYIFIYFHRLVRLLGELTGRKEGKLLVFTETKRKCDEITRMVRRDGFNALCIHGDKAQPERDWVLQEFREGKCEILIATDVAARGLGMFHVWGFQFVGRRFRIIRWWCGHVCFFAVVGTVPLFLFRVYFLLLFSFRVYFLFNRLFGSIFLFLYFPFFGVYSFRSWRLFFFGSSFSSLFTPSFIVVLLYIAILCFCISICACMRRSVDNPTR